MFETVTFIKAGLALVFILGMIGSISWGYKYFLLKSPGQKSYKKRIYILENRTLDSKNRLVLIKRDQVEHLILLNHSAPQVVESIYPSSKKTVKSRR